VGAQASDAHRRHCCHWRWLPLEGAAPRSVRLAGLVLGQVRSPVRRPAPQGDGRIRTVFTPKRSLVRSQYRPPGSCRSELGFRSWEAWLLIVCQPFVNRTGQQYPAWSGALGDRCRARPSFASKGSGVRIPSSPPRNWKFFQVRALIDSIVDQGPFFVPSPCHQDQAIGSDTHHALGIPMEASQARKEQSFGHRSV
jgi:hypothetical protein